MNIVFIGTTHFGLRCLEALLGVPECEVVGAVAAPPVFPISYRPEGVGNVLHADVPEYCAERGIPVEIISDGMRSDALFNQVSEWRPDAFLVAGWYHMIPRCWRELAPAYGLHASLLPDYSGGAPLVWAIINGETRTGITLFQMGDGVDSGPILGQAGTPIFPDDNIATLYARIEELGVDLVRTKFPLLAKGQAVLEVQDESKRRMVPQRSPEDGLVDWNQPAPRLHDFVRAQTSPYPGAFAWSGEDKLTIWSSRVATGESPEILPGEPMLESGRLFVGCGGGSVLELIDIAINGRSVPVSSFVRRGLLTGSGAAEKA